MLLKHLSRMMLLEWVKIDKSLLKKTGAKLKKMLCIDALP